MRRTSAPQSRPAVVAITGASAGVGRATARAFAQEGARVALLARDRTALEETRAEVEAVGGEAIALPVDVADADAVFEAAQQIEEQLGPIDVWVNNAMVTVFSNIGDLTPEEIRRVTEVTYLGCVHGTLAALRHMRRRDRGVIVQVGSSLAYRGIPLQAAYCGAKHAARGFTESVVTELLREGSGVRITSVHLPAVNTPQFDWARTHRTKAPRPVAPVYATRTAARAIVHAARRPAREYWLGAPTPLLILATSLFPGLLDRWLAATAVDGQDRPNSVAEDRADNLFAPARGHRTDGAFGGEAKPRALLVSAPAARIGALAAGSLAVGLVGAAVGAGLALCLRKRTPGP